MQCKTTVKQGKSDSGLTILGYPWYYLIVVILVFIILVFGCILLSQILYRRCVLLRQLSVERGQLADLDSSLLMGLSIKDYVEFKNRPKNSFELELNPIAKKERKKHEKQQQQQKERQIHKHIGAHSNSKSKSSFATAFKQKCINSAVREQSDLHFPIINYTVIEGDDDYGFACISLATTDGMNTVVYHMSQDSRMTTTSRGSSSSGSGSSTSSNDDDGDDDDDNYNDDDNENNNNNDDNRNNEARNKFIRDINKYINDTIDKRNDSLFSSQDNNVDSNSNPNRFNTFTVEASNDHVLLETSATSDENDNENNNDDGNDGDGVNGASEVKNRDIIDSRRGASETKWNRNAYRVYAGFDTIQSQYNGSNAALFIAKDKPNGRNISHYYLYSNSPLPPDPPKKGKRNGTVTTNGYLTDILTGLDDMEETLRDIFNDIIKVGDDLMDMVNMQKLQLLVIYVVMADILCSCHFAHVYCFHIVHFALTTETVSYEDQLLIHYSSYAGESTVILGIRLGCDTCN